MAMLHNSEISTVDENELEGEIKVWSNIVAGLCSNATDSVIRDCLRLYVCMYVCMYVCRFTSFTQ